MQSKTALDNSQKFPGHVIVEFKQSDLYFSNRFLKESKLGAIFRSKGNLFQYSQTLALSLKQLLFRALYFAFELCPNFDKRFNLDLLNLKTSLDKEKLCFALYTSMRSPLAQHSTSVALSAPECLVFLNMGVGQYL